MTRTLEDDAKELLESTIDDYKADEPISAGTLNSTIASGIGTVLTAVGGGAGSIFAATNGAKASVVIATLAVVAVAVLALALIIRSDHQSRTSVTLDVIRSIPELITAAHQSEAHASASGPNTPTAAISPAALVTRNGAKPGSEGQVLLVDLQVVFKSDAAPSKVIAVRISPLLEMLALRPGLDHLEWIPSAEVDPVAV